MRGRGGRRGDGNGTRSLRWLEEFLTPALQPGDVVVMGNASFHKSLPFRAAIEGAGAIELDFQDVNAAFGAITASDIRGFAEHDGYRFFE